MRDRLLRLAESAEVAIASANGVIDDDELKPLRHSVRSLRLRLGYPEHVPVIALAGGTGSGKSSLFNALTGEDLAEVGGVRPTTERAVAAVPADELEAMSGLFDYLEIEDRFGFDGDLCLIDLPDYDSIVTDHRDTVDKLVPMVDMVVWVVDPEKYRDARLHHEYLAPLSAYQAQFVFVLNQIDRVDEEAVERIGNDFTLALEEDGISEPVVFHVAARPPSGPPVGVEGLTSWLRDMADNEAALHKLEVDITGLASTLSSRLGSGLRFDSRASEVVDLAADDVVRGEIASASTRLVRFLEEMASSAGGPIGEAIRRVAADTPRHVARIADSATHPPVTGRFGRVKETPQPDFDEVATLLNKDIIRPARAHLAKRGLAVAAITEFVVQH